MQIENMPNTIRKSNKTLRNAVKNKMSTKSLWKYFVQFSKNASIHGSHHLIAEKRHPSEM